LKRPKKIKKTLTPKWEAQHEFYVSDPEAVLELTLWDWNRFRKDEFMGKIEIKPTELEDGVETETWFKLVPEKPGQRVSGELYVKLLYRKEKS